MFTHDLVLMNPEDARQLIGLPQGYACDLAIDVFHENEQDAILSDPNRFIFLAGGMCHKITEPRALCRPFESRQDACGHCSDSWCAGVVPSGCGKHPKIHGRQSDLGIMKAMGWTTGDIVRFQLYRNYLSACLRSLWASACLLFWYTDPAQAGPLIFFLAGTPCPLPFTLNQQALQPLCWKMAGLMWCPMLASALLPALKGATARCS